MNINFAHFDKAGFKKRLQQKCIRMIELRIAAAATAVDNAQAAANAEDKSSAGDKYETSRAMAHLEKDLYARQLAANQQELAALSSIDCSTLYHTAVTGSFIVCEQYSFFIAAGLGKIQFEGMDIYLLSPQAPLAKILFKKIIGQTLTFNKKELAIGEIF